MHKILVIRRMKRYLIDLDMNSHVYQQRSTRSRAVNALVWLGSCDLIQDCTPCLPHPPYLAVETLVQAYSKFTFRI